MQAHELIALTCASHPLKVWERYVDDVFAIIKRTYLVDFFELLNILHTNIKFTTEEENEAYTVSWLLNLKKQWRKTLYPGI